MSRGSGATAVINRRIDGPIARRPSAPSPAPLSPPHRFDSPGSRMTGDPMSGVGRILEPLSPEDAARRGIGILGGPVQQKPGGFGGLK